MIKEFEIDKAAQNIDSGKGSAADALVILEAYQHGWIDMDDDTRPGHSFDFTEKTYEIIKQALLKAANIKED
jgi:hypothetical protein